MVAEKNATWRCEKQTHVNLQLPLTTARAGIFVS
jgi:hypothetical protein